MKRILIIVAVLALAALAVWIVAMDQAAPVGHVPDPTTDAGTEQPAAGGGSGIDVAVPEDAESMVVVSIHDGDTMNLRDGTGATETVRIIGVDTPEVYPQYECFGDEATDELNRLAPVGSTLRVTVDEDPFDDYDRLLLYLWNDQGVFVNLALVEGGFAEAIRVAPNDAYYDELRAAEDSAAHDGLGMWGC
jgi:micrococcal nuclease